MYQQCFLLQCCLLSHFGKSLLPDGVSCHFFSYLCIALLLHLFFCFNFYTASDALSLELIGYAREIDDRTYAQLSFRAVLMRFFRDMQRSDIEGERAALQRGPVGLLPLLPKEFTRDDVRALRIAQGMKPDPRDMLAQWIKRSLIRRDDERSTFVKC